MDNSSWIDHFKCEPHLCEASFGTGDTSKGGIVAIFYFSTFFIGAVLLSQKIKMNFFSTMINSLATLALVAHYLHKYFKHVYLKCGNELVSENSDIQLQSGNWANTLKMSVNRVPLSLQNRVPLSLQNKYFKYLKCQSSLSTVNATVPWVSQHPSALSGFSSHVP